MLRLETARLELRSFTPEDAERLFELDHDPQVMRFIGPYGLDSVEAYRERIESVYVPYAARADGLGLWAAWEKASGQFVGWCCLRPAADYRFAVEAGFRANDAELGYRLRPSAWGQGFATEVSRALIRDVIERGFAGDVVASALAANRASTRVMEKCSLRLDREFRLPGFAEVSVSYALRNENFASLRY